MTMHITKKQMIATFRAAAANCHNEAGQTLDGYDYDTLKQQQARYHTYADRLQKDEPLNVVIATNPTERATAAAEAFLEVVCALDHNHDAFAKVICAQHRTHQQSVMRAMYAVMMQLAKEEHDMRNEATVAFCKRVTGNGDFFPFI